MATPGFDLKAALSNLSHATNEGLEQALDVVQGYVTPLSDTINSALQDIGIAQSPSSMTSRARDRVERNFASLRWQYMDSLRLPLQQPPVWDARMLLTLANLGNVLVNQVSGKFSMLARGWVAEVLIQRSRVKVWQKPVF